MNNVESFHREVEKQIHNGGDAVRVSLEIAKDPVLRIKQLERALREIVGYEATQWADEDAKACAAIARAALGEPSV